MWSEVMKPSKKEKQLRKQILEFIEVLITVKPIRTPWFTIWIKMK